MEAERPKSFTPRARKFERPEGGPDALTDAVEGELGMAASSFAVIAVWPEMVADYHHQ
jgi:hypothetical protein